MSKHIGHHDMALCISTATLNTNLRNVWRSGQDDENFFFNPGANKFDRYALPNNKIANKWAVWLRGPEVQGIWKYFAPPMIDDLKNYMETCRKVNRWDQRPFRDGYFAVLADLNFPRVNVIEQDGEGKIILEIHIEKGTIYSEGEWNDQTKLLHDTTEIEKKDKIKFALEVKLGQEKVTSEHNVLTLTQGGTLQQQKIADFGIKDKEFSIEAIYLDFKMSDFADYLPEYSHLDLDKNEKTRSHLDTAIKDFGNTCGEYARNRGKENWSRVPANTYNILYGLTRKEAGNSTKALFSPTDIQYTASYSNKRRCSTVNLMMQLDGHPFPEEGAISDRFRQHLETVLSGNNSSGVLAINLKEFERKYMPVAAKNLQDSLFEKIDSWHQGQTKIEKSYSEERDEYIIAWSDKTDARQEELFCSFKYLSAKQFKGGHNGENEPSSIALLFELRISAYGHYVRDKGESFLEFTTEPGYQRIENGQDIQSKHGVVAAVLKAGASGKVECTFELIDNPEVGVKKSQMAPSHEEYIDNNKMASGFDDFLDRTFTFKEEISPLDEMVLLPASGGFMYKDVRLLDEKNEDKDNNLVLFTATFGRQVSQV